MIALSITAFLRTWLSYDWISILEHRESGEEHVTLVANDLPFPLVLLVVCRARRVPRTIQSSRLGVVNVGGPFAADVLGLTD